jgi:hypothetical protein
MHARILVGARKAKYAPEQPIEPTTASHSATARYIKLRSGTRDEPVNQEASRVFTVLVASLEAFQGMTAEAEE